jgi:hypothetical protein
MRLIELNNEASQQFTIELEQRIYIMWVYYNSRGQYFMFDLLNEDEETIAQGIPIVAFIDLLNNMRILDGDLVVFSDPPSTPKIGDFGITHELYYLTREELELAGL